MTTRSRADEGACFNYPFLTSKERDNETGLDYFEARYYSSIQGRFTSVDPENAGAALWHPQSWNGYAYSLNNPLRFIDPDGLRWAQIAVGDGLGYNWFDDNDKDANGQTEYARALANGYSAVTFDESKSFSYTSGLLAPGETLTTVTLSPDGPAASSISTHTVTWGQWTKFLALTSMLDLGASNFETITEGRVQPTSIPGTMLSDFVSSLVGVDTNIYANLPSAPGPAVGVGSTDKLSKKADDLISGSLKRSPSYRSELAQKTYREIRDLAKKGGSQGRAAKGMKKLIEQAERLREKVKGK